MLRLNITKDLLLGWELGVRLKARLKKGCYQSNYPLFMLLFEPEGC